MYLCLYGIAVEEHLQGMEPHGQPWPPPRRYCKGTIAGRSGPENNGFCCGC